MMNGTTLALIKKHSGSPTKDPFPGRMDGRDWTRVDNNIESFLPLICPRIIQGRKWHLSRKASKPCGGCQGFTGPEPSTLLDETARISCQLGPLYGFIRKSSTILPFLKKYFLIHLRGRSPSPFVGSAINPDRYASACRAASRPSLIAHTIRDCPRRASPAAKIPGTFVW